MSTVLPTVERLSGRVLRILGLNPGIYTLQGTNTYVIGTGFNRLLLDAGEADREDYCSLLADILKKEEARISKIVISHWHHDHLGGLASVLSTVCKDFSPVIYKLPLEQNTPLHYPSRGEDKEEPAPTEKDFVYVKDGDVLEVEGAQLRVIATPGHTKDHLCLWLRDDKTLFTADCILGEGTAVFEELGPYMNSLEKLLALKPKTLYPGHGPVVDEGVAKIQHYLAHRRAREQQVLKVLESASIPMTPRQVVEIIYKDVSQDLWLGAENNVKLILDKLHHDQLVQKSKHSEYEWVLVSRL